MTHNPIVIFVRPKAHGNVGALTRVMSNFDIQELRLVQAPRGEDAVTFVQNEEGSQLDSRIDWALACRGKSILENAKVYKTLEEALERVHFSVGTTARHREQDTGYARPVYDFEDFLIQKESYFSHNWALVLGPEDDGLNDHEAALCNALVSIPTSDKSPSMNVAMAAGCLLYHWSTYSKKLKPQQLKAPKTRLATQEEIDKLSCYIMETLKLTDFFKYPDDGAVLGRIRRIYQGEALSQGDVLFAFEIAYQMRCKMLGHHEERNFLSKV